MMENIKDDFKFFEIEDVGLVDDNDVDSGRVNVQPWDPTKIRITTKHFSLRDIVEQIRDEDINLSPDFQRDYVWKKRQKTRLIESVLLGIPLPVFYFNQDKEGAYQVVDGVQRLSTIYQFMTNNHVLDRSDLEYLDLVGGFSYSDLDQALVRRLRSTQIVVHVIEPQTPDEVKYDIFGRVNTLGSPLSAQEIRHAMSKPVSRKFLKELAEMEEFDEATNWQYWRRDSEATSGRVRDSGRMTNRELVLRFCAFRFSSIEEYREHQSLDAFLVEFTKRIDGCSEFSENLNSKNLNKLKAEFKRAMRNAKEVLGEFAFRRSQGGRKGPINRAVFESQAVALADYPLNKLLPKKYEIAEGFKSLFKDQKYIVSVTVGTGAPATVENRLLSTKKILQEILGD